MNTKFSMVDLMFESKSETKEQATSIKIAGKAATLIDDIARILKVESKLVTKAIAKSTDDITKEITSASKKFIKGSDPKTLAAMGDQVPKNIKNLSKELAIKRLYDATKNLEPGKSLSKARVKDIIESTKTETKLLFKDAQIGIGSTTKGVKGVKKVKPANTTTKTTTQNIKQAANSVGTKVMGWFKRNKKTTTKVANSATPVIKKRLVTAIKVKFLGIPLLKLLLIGGAGYIGYKWWTRYTGDLPEFPSDDDINATKDWMECIVNALEGDERAHDIVIGENKNSIQYDIDRFAGEDTGGYLTFYDDYTVKSKNGKTGKWDCNVTKNLKEQSEGEVTSQMISSAITQLDDQLSGDFFEGDSSDMQDAYKILKSLEGTTYKGKDTIQVIKNNYPKVTGKKLSSHIGNLTNLDFTAIELRDEMLKMIGSSPKKKGGGSQGDSDDKGGSKDNDNLNHLTVVWDKSEGGGGSKGSKYKQCDDFPLNLYCISDKIKEVQKCLNPTANLKVDGYYGPLTLKAMRDSSLFADDKKDDTNITKVIYDRIIDKCNKAKDAVKDADGKAVRPKVEPIEKLKIKPIEIVKLDPIKMIDTHGVENLLDQTKKRIDGERISAIISDKVKFRGGRYVLKMDNELTEKQLKVINQVMAGRGFSLDKKKETLKDNKYVWTTKDRDSRKIARKQNSIDNIRSKNDDKK